MTIGGKEVNPFNPLQLLGSKKQQALKQNVYTYNAYFNMLEEIACNVFEWHGLPETVDQRFMELTLFEQGSVLYFRDEYVGDVTLPWVMGEDWNLYMVPITRYPYSWSGFQGQCNPKNSVIIWNNYLRTPTAYIIAWYAYRLADIERTMEVNVRAQKTPVAILCDEKELLSFKNIYAEIDGNTPVLFGTKNLDLDRIKAISTHAPFIADKTQLLLRQTWNEALTFLGVYNGSSEKRERQVSQEAIASQGGVGANRAVLLNSRQQAAREINRLFGTNISVNINEQVMRAGFDDSVKEWDGETDGTIHD